MGNLMRNLKRRCTSSTRWWEKRIPVSCQLSWPFNEYDARLGGRSSGAYKKIASTKREIIIYPGVKRRARVMHTKINRGRWENRGRKSRTIAQTIGCVPIFTWIRVDWFLRGSLPCLSELWCLKREQREHAYAVMFGKASSVRASQCRQKKKLCEPGNLLYRRLI